MHNLISNQLSQNVQVGPGIGNFESSPDSCHFSWGWESLSADSVDLSSQKVGKYTKCISA